MSDAINSPAEPELAGRPAHAASPAASANDVGGSAARAARKKAPAAIYDREAREALRKVGAALAALPPIVRLSETEERLAAAAKACAELE